MLRIPEAALGSVLLGDLWASGFGVESCRNYGKKGGLGSRAQG